MKINIEKEYKILVSEHEFYDLLKFYPNALFKTQINTYYDNESNTIQDLHGAMRIRQLDSLNIFTLKLHSEKGLMEFEKIVKEHNISMLDEEEIQQLLASHHIDGPFRELTTLSTSRAIIDTLDAELCFDINSYQNQKDYEVEYEYKRNHDGFRAFNDILAKINRNYKTNCSSKITRARNSL